MGNFKENFKVAYKNRRANATSAGAAQNDYVYKLAKTALRAGIISAIAVFFIAFYACEIAIIWSILLALVSFIVVQPIVSLFTVLVLKK